MSRQKTIKRSSHANLLKRNPLTDTIFGDFPKPIEHLTIDTPWRRDVVVLTTA